MPKFAHMADVHLGAHREPHLQRLEMEAFQAAMSRCIELDVDFVLICGDLFHVGIPDLGIVDSAIKVMIRAQEQGIPIYAIYGSHDYTPNGTSVIDILNTVGVLTNVFRPKMDSGRLKLGLTVDKKTGAKIAGISARKVGLESRYYEILDRAAIEEERGFRVFAFHSGITQFRPANLKEMETVDISLFPRGLDYYAGGHIHQRGEFSLSGYDRIVFPGPLFTGYGRDLEDTARGAERGFYVVDFDDKVKGTSFIPIQTFGSLYKEYDLGGANAVEANRRVGEDLGRLDVSGKVVVIKAYGELAGGRVADVDFGRMKLGLMGRGALYVHLNRSSLTSRESGKPAAAGEDPATTEEKFFESRIGSVKVSAPGLKGHSGSLLGKELLRLLRQPPKMGEAKRDYQTRMVRDGARMMKLEEVHT
ncbi:MAG: DNA repair exonuclease [Nitrososphaerales archaeon]|nr:DNA repair exonuclease [Nitrososphaerales archaeon]